MPPKLLVFVTKEKTNLTVERSHSQLKGAKQPEDSSPPCLVHVVTELPIHRSRRQIWVYTLKMWEQIPKIQKASYTLLVGKGTTFIGIHIIIKYNHMHMKNTSCFFFARELQSWLPARSPGPRGTDPAHLRHQEFLDVGLHG